MVLGPGLDKLNLIYPGSVRLRPDFARQLRNPANIKILNIKPGEGYRETADLRGVNLDLRLSMGNRFNDKAGMKIEVIEVGAKSYSDVDGLLRQIVDGDPDVGELVRVDLTADFEKIRVSDFERAMYVTRKQTSQTEYADGVTRNFRRGRGDTIYFGRDDQVRIYNKTEHRKVLLNEENRKRRRGGLPLLTFFEMWGYEPTEIRTRVERQCGSRAAERLWNIKYLGEIHKLADVDPFANFKFLHDAKRGKDFDELGPTMQMLLDLLRDYTEQHSVIETRTFIRQRFENPRSCRKFLQEYESFFMHPTLLNGELLTAQFRRSIINQLAA